ASGGATGSKSRQRGFDVELVRWGTAAPATPEDLAEAMFPPSGRPPDEAAATWQWELFHRIFQKDASRYVTGAAWLILRALMARGVKLQLQGRQVVDLGIAHGLFFRRSAEGPEPAFDGVSALAASRADAFALCMGEDRRVIMVPSFTSLGVMHKWILLRLGEDSGDDSQGAEFAADLWLRRVPLIHHQTPFRQSLLIGVRPNMAVVHMVRPSSPLPSSTRIRRTDSVSPPPAPRRERLPPLLKAIQRGGGKAEVLAALTELQLQAATALGGVLLRPFVFFNPAFEPPLCLAARCGHDSEVLRTLLEHGADVNEENKFGQTALSILCTDLPCLPPKNCGHPGTAYPCPPVPCPGALRAAGLSEFDFEALSWPVLAMGAAAFSSHAPARDGGFKSVCEGCAEGGLRAARCRRRPGAWKGRPCPGTPGSCQGVDVAGQAAALLPSLTSLLHAQPWEREHAAFWPDRRSDSDGVLVP
ncbi:unnamed protein product, partial [Polarella glacialis]